MVKVGDIVKTKEKEGNRILSAVVTYVYMTPKCYGSTEKVVGWVNVLFADGSYGNRSEKKFTETGRHIDIQSILDSIR